MDQEIKAKWVNALRSGRYKQGRVRMYDGEAYCCLGVLCKVARLPMDNYIEVAKVVGGEEVVAQLWRLNDDPSHPPFDVIAGFIDETL